MPKLKLLSIRAASKTSGISYQVLRKAVKTGRIKTITLSRRPMISAEALKAFIHEANRHTAWLGRPTSVASHGEETARATGRRVQSASLNV
jgi:predicted site-specific integrase-resolvase